MEIVRFNDLEFIPASHEDPKNPSNFKKVLLKRDDLPEGRIQMINWATIPKRKSFAPHYHEKMVEVFVIMSGQIKAKINSDTAVLTAGDAVVVNPYQVHSFENITDNEISYLTIGIVTAEGGKTVIV